MGVFLKLDNAGISASGGVPIAALTPQLGVPGYDLHLSAEDFAVANQTTITTPWVSRLGGWSVPVVGIPKKEARNGFANVSFPSSQSSYFTLADASLGGAPRSTLLAFAGTTDNAGPRTYLQVGGYLLTSDLNVGWSVKQRNTNGLGSEVLRVAGAPNHNDFMFLAYLSIDAQGSLDLRVLKHATAPAAGTASGTTPGTMRPQFSIGGAYGNGGAMSRVWSWPRVLTAAERDKAMAAAAAAYLITPTS